MGPGDSQHSNLKLHLWKLKPETKWSMFVEWTKMGPRPLVIVFSMDLLICIDAHFRVSVNIVKSYDCRQFPAL